MTEFAGAITQTPWDREQREGSVGIPSRSRKLRCWPTGDPSRPLAERRNSRARAADVLRLFRPAAGRRDFHEGWLRSGDLGRIGADGEVYVTGRAKDVIIRGGHNIDPASIEDVALNFPGVGLAAAVGRPDPYAGETPILFVAPARRDDRRAALADFMRAGVAEPPARPRSIVVIDEMPVTPVGKIFKPRCARSPPKTPRANCWRALPGISFQVAASHTERGLVLHATVPVHADEAAASGTGEIAGGIRGRSLQPRGRRLTKGAADAAEAKTRWPDAVRPRARAACADMAETTD